MTDQKNECIAEAREKLDLVNAKIMELEARANAVESASQRF